MGRRLVNVDNDILYAARLRGDTTYTPTVPCKRGHISDRYTANNGCVQCLKKEYVKSGNGKKRYTLIIPKEHDQLMKEIVKSLDGIML